MINTTPEILPQADKLNDYKDYPLEFMQQAAKLAFDRYPDEEIKRKLGRLELEHRCMGILLAEYLSNCTRSILSVIVDALDDANARQMSSDMAVLRDHWPALKDSVFNLNPPAELEESIALIHRAACQAAHQYFTEEAKTYMTLDQRMLEGLGVVLSHYVGYCPDSICRIGAITLRHCKSLEAACYLDQIAENDERRTLAQLESTADGKRVIFDPPLIADEANPIPLCCGNGGNLRMLPSIRQLDQEGKQLEEGYTVVSKHCHCPSRWLPHPWKTKGHAVFISVNKK